MSAVGSHAALAHYSPTEDSDRQIARKELYLVQSGAQYLGYRFSYQFIIEFRFIGLNRILFSIQQMEQLT